MEMRGLRGLPELLRMLTMLGGLAELVRMAGLYRRLQVHRQRGQCMLRGLTERLCGLPVVCRLPELLSPLTEVLRRLR